MDNELMPPPSEQEIIEAQIEAQQDLTDHVDATEVVTECHAGLEAVAAALEAHVNDLDPTAATWLWASFESHTTRMGMSSDLPSLEGLKSPRLAAYTVQLSLETVKEKLQHVWESLVHMFKKLWEQFMRFLGVDKMHMKKVAAELREVRIAIAKLKYYPAAKEVELRGYAAKAALSYGKSDYLSLAVMQKTANNWESLDLFVNAVARDYNKAIVKALRDPSRSETWVDAIKQLKELERLWKTHVLPTHDSYLGGYLIKIDTKHAAANAGEDTIESLTAPFRNGTFNLTLAESKADQSTVKVTRPPLKDLTNIVDQLSRRMNRWYTAYSHLDAEGTVRELEQSLKGLQTGDSASDAPAKIRMMISAFSRIAAMRAQLSRASAHTLLGYAEAFKRCLKSTEIEHSGANKDKEPEVK